MRKFLAAAAVAGLTVAIMAGPASAHECYNTNRSSQGNSQIAAHSPSFTTFDESAMGFLTEEVGLCEAGAQWLIDQLHAAADAGTLDFDPNVVVSIRATQAGGIDNSPNARAQSNLANGKGIDHLAENVALNEFLAANIPAAFGQCVV
jgi:hypothetical protein